MGLLDQFIGGGNQGSSSSLESVVAAGALLALMAHGRRQAQGAGPAQGGGLGGLLGGLMGAAPGLLSGLGGGGGAGAIQALLDRFSERGYGAHVASWLGNGPNQPLQPQDVQNALGDGVLSKLEQQTGAPRQSLLSELAAGLPQVIDHLSPGGQIDETGLRALLQGAAPRPH